MPMVLDPFPKIPLSSLKADFYLCTGVAEIGDSTQSSASEIIPIYCGYLSFHLHRPHISGLLIKSLFFDSHGF
jgi:hypothetical protein